MTALKMIFTHAYSTDAVVAYVKSFTQTLTFFTQLNDFSRRSRVSSSRTNNTRSHRSGIIIWVLIHVTTPNTSTRPQIVCSTQVNVKKCLTTITPPLHSMARLIISDDWYTESYISRGSRILAWTKMTDHFVTHFLGFSVWWWSKST